MKTYNRLSDIQQDLKKRLFTCESLVRSYLERIESFKHLNAFLEIYEKEALEKARSIDRDINNGGWKELYGAVIGIKDVLCHKGHKVSASSRILQNFESLYSATAVERLDNAGAIIIGRTNCDEFAMGSSNENSSYGPVLNAVDNDRVPGGSSGGSAVAVQANLCLASLGTDTGGSIRQPASLCGIIGMKPSYGRISRYGLLAYASSFDQIGPFTRSVEDAALLTHIMAGQDEFDSTTSSEEVPAFEKLLATEKSMRIAVYSEILNSKDIDKAVLEQLIKTIEGLRKDGHVIEEVSFPYLNHMVPAYYVLTTAEASSNLARYDGVHYGYRPDNTETMEEVYKLSRSEGFGEEVKRRIMLGTFVLSAGYHEAYYSKGQKVRKLILNRTKEIFEDYDFVLSPTTPGPAFEIGAKTDDPVSMYLSDIFTVQANLVGMPAISLPLTQSADNLPFGMQLMANKFEESKLFSFAHKLMSKKNVLVTI